MSYLPWAEAPTYWTWLSLVQTTMCSQSWRCPQTEQPSSVVWSFWKYRPYMWAHHPLELQRERA